MHRLALLVLVGFAFAVPLADSRALATTRPRSGPQAGLTAPQASISRKAEAAWKPFLAKFTNALKRRDRAALYKMAAPDARANCSHLRAAAARHYLFDEARTLDHYLDIVTPERNKVHSYHEPQYAFDGEDNIGRVWLSMSCWSLQFEYRAHTGWLMTFYDQPCEGC